MLFRSRKKPPRSPPPLMTSGKRKTRRPVTTRHPLLGPPRRPKRLSPNRNGLKLRRASPNQRRLSRFLRRRSTPTTRSTRSPLRPSTKRIRKARNGSARLRSCGKPTGRGPRPNQNGRPSWKKSWPTREQIPLPRKPKRITSMRRRSGGSSISRATRTSSPNSISRSTTPFNPF